MTNTTDPSARATNTSLSRLEAVTWGGFGFLIGMTVGGFLVSLFTGIILAILSAAAGTDLSLTPEGQLFRLAFVILGMILVGILGVLVSFANRSQANAEREELARQQEIARLKAVEDEAAARARGELYKPPTDQPAPDSRTAPGLTANILESVRYTGFLLADTVRLLLPSPVVSTKRSDQTYITNMSKSFKEMLTQKVDLEPQDKDFILRNWVEQIEWSNNRANRERDANEMISWWQIILTALIPFIATISTPIAGIPTATIVAILGIFVTILTGLVRFRRPEERWKHYRRLTEDYQRELLNFIALSGENYKDATHRDRFSLFNERMMTMRENDIRVFLGEVMNNVSAQVASPSGGKGSVGGTTQVINNPPGVLPQNDNG